MDKNYRFYHQGKKLPLKKASSFLGTILSYSVGTPEKLNVVNSLLVKTLKEDFNVEKIKFDRIYFFGKTYIRVFIEGICKFYVRL